jgi:hypothetical protein
MYNLSQIKKAVTSKGYVWFDDELSKSYDVNIVGVRNCSPAAYKKVTNVFDDWITISYKDETGAWKFFCWNATTDPGKKGTEQFQNSRGVARLVPGQYRRTWMIDRHQGRYEALCQRLAAVTVWRDSNRDMIFDESMKDTGMFGINIHKAGQDSVWVENWSEGCQVFKRVKDFDAFMNIVKKSAKIHGNKFSYTLLESTDIT